MDDIWDSRCGYCLERFKTGELCLEHFISQHAKIRDSSKTYCFICNARVSEAVEVHMKTLHPTNCYVCTGKISDWDAEEFSSWIHQLCCIDFCEMDRVFADKIFEFYS